MVLFWTHLYGFRSLRIKDKIITLCLFSLKLSNTDHIDNRSFYSQIERDKIPDPFERIFFFHLQHALIPRIKDRSVMGPTTVSAAPTSTQTSMNYSTPTNVGAMFGSHSTTDAA